MKSRSILLPALALASCAGQPSAERPNVIVILADDLGCGDLSALGCEVLHTPNLDRLCAQGLNLTNGHAAAPTSTPSRYSLMTGLYPWRNSDAEVLTGDANLLIADGQPTLAGMMRQAGYATGAVGKWHLGLGRGPIDWNRPISPSPADVGFDYSFIMAATVDRVPTVYVENGGVVGLDASDPLEVSYTANFPGEPTALTNPEMLRLKPSMGHSCSIVNGIPRIGFMRGGHSACWVDEEMADEFLARAKGFIDDNRDRPFFLYYGLHQPHVPRVPHMRFAGKSGMGARGDAILEADWCVGELMRHLGESGLAENTIVIFTSDNGPVLDDGYVDQARELWGDVSPAQPYRGGKYSLFDGGTHVPFFVRWPGHVRPGRSDALVCQMDLFASLAGLLGQPVPEGLDSRNTLDAFLGRSPQGRDEIVYGSMGRLTYRHGDWQLIPPFGGPAVDATDIETGNSDAWTLYDLKTDVSQRTNLAAEHPEKVSAMRVRLNEIIRGHYEF